MSPRHATLTRLAWALAAFGVLGCDSRLDTLGVIRDGVAPEVSISLTSGDTLEIPLGITFTASASDNLGLKVMSVGLSGVFAATVDTVFVEAVTAYVVPVQLALPDGQATGKVVITATARDGSGNAAVATDEIVLVP